LSLILAVPEMGDAGKANGGTMIPFDPVATETGTFRGSPYVPIQVPVAKITPGQRLTPLPHAGGSGLFQLIPTNWGTVRALIPTQWDAKILLVATPSQTTIQRPGQVSHDSKGLLIFGSANSKQPQRQALSSQFR
jgi:hypothetical protein